MSEHYRAAKRSLKKVSSLRFADYRNFPTRWKRSRLGESLRVFARRTAACGENSRFLHVHKIKLQRFIILAFPIFLASALFVRVTNTNDSASALGFIEK